MTVYCATTNPGKLREFRLAASEPLLPETGVHGERPLPYGRGSEPARGVNSKLSRDRKGAVGPFDRIEVVSLPCLAAIPPAEETGDTFEANAIEKALYYSAHAPGYLFADDSGLEVDALGGAPGVLSARFAGPGATDQANNRLLVEKLQGVPDRTARFVCVIAVARAGRLARTFRGAVEGRIIDEPRGPNGFGYDPLFFYPPFGCTFGEVDADRKMTVSHRGQALAEMMAWLLREG